MIGEQIPRRSGPSHPVPRYVLVRRGRRLSLRRSARPVRSPHAVLPTSLEAAALFRECMRGARREQAWVAVLGDREEALGVVLLAVGTDEDVVYWDSELCGVVAAFGATSFLVAHNHPSGDPTPSVDDWVGTRAGVEAAARVGLEYVDHLVVAGDRYASLRAMNEAMFPCP